MIFLSFSLSLFFFFFFLFFFFVICQTYKRQKYMSRRHYEDVSDNIAPGYVKLFLIARFMPRCAPPVWMRSARERFLTWRYVEKDYTKDVSEEIAARGKLVHLVCLVSLYKKQIKGLAWGINDSLFPSPFWSFQRYRDNRNVIEKIRKKYSKISSPSK